jgi:hypothetical protein
MYSFLSSHKIWINLAPIVEEITTTKQLPKHKKKLRKGHHQVSFEETISDSPPNISDQESIINFGSEEVEEIIHNGTRTNHFSVELTRASKSNPLDLTQVENGPSKVNQSSHLDVTI